MQLAPRALARRNIIGLILIVIASVILFSRPAFVQSAQSSKRSFENKIPPQVPLKVKIKKDKEEKALDLNNKNWFRDIEIEVTNTSDKPIYFLSLDVLMPDVLTENGVITTFPLRYGRTDFYDHNTKPLPEDIPIEPKATYTFVFEEDNKIGYEAFRTRTKKDDPRRLEVWISHLSFGDGTGFTSMSGVPFPFKNNPEELGRCLQKARPPNQWAETPTIVSAFYAKNFRTPAAFLPVNFFAESYVSEKEVFTSTASPDICCPATSCNKFKFSTYDCVCAINAQTVQTTPCSDPIGVCGTQIQIAPLCSFQGVSCPRFTFIACGGEVPNPTPAPSPTPTPEFSCPSTDPTLCPSGIAKDPCRDPFDNGCPPFFHPEGACCVRDPCFYAPIVCPEGTRLLQLPSPACAQFCVDVPGLTEAECLAWSFLWSFNGGSCRETPPTGESECLNFGWFWNPVSDFCQSDSPPPCELFPEVCDSGGWSFEWCTCVPINSPILVDVAGNGFNLTSSAAGVDFNLNNMGGKERLGWTSAAADDAWLALDRNGNGTIDNGAELFGDLSPQPQPLNGEKKNGFRTLREYDKTTNGGNADGQIDSRDSIFSSLQLWQDENHNGVSEAGELHTLTSLNVAIFELDYKASGKTDVNGNRFSYRAKIRNSRGEQSGRWAWDVYLIRAF